MTITDPRMTRFIMSVNQSVRLVMDSVGLAKGGEVFVTKMPAIRIEELARVMIEELAPLYGYNSGQIQIETIGVKPGEKLYEELINAEETRRSFELQKYFVILPAFRSVYSHIAYEYPGTISNKTIQPYTSEQVEPMNREDLKTFLKTNRLVCYS